MRRDEAQAIDPAGGICRVDALRFPAGQPAVEEECWVVEERALFLDVADVGLYTLMWTRGDGAGAAGFLPGDGVLGDTAAPDALAVCADSPDVVRVRLADPARNRSNRRGGVVASSCGVCGGVENADDPLAALPRVADTLRIDVARFGPMMLTMRERQHVFNTTGGTHAAALFSGQAELLCSAEDLGRHNALDKVIGQCLLRGRPLAGCGVLLSGRVSLEMIVKAARAGIELVAAVSAPSSLAIEAAERAGITLCGFVRQGRLTAFTHAQRLR
jgi:FdhD protein